MFFILILLTCFQILIKRIDCRLSTKPNFILLVADDLGYGDLSSYGHPTIISTRIDEMARNGLRFTQAYAGSSVCTPSRAAFQTSRYPIRSGFGNSFIPVIIDPAQPSGLPYNETTIAEALKTLGYKTAMIGKWHLGINKYANNDGLNMPNNHGYDQYYGNIMGQSHGCTVENPSPIGCILYRNNEIIEQPIDMTTITRKMTEEAIKFIRENEENPFLLVFNYMQVHTALFASTEFKDTSLRGDFGDNVMEMDNSVSQILDYLRQMNLDKDTLVIFTSDNGPYLEERFNGGSSGLFHGGKAQTNEGGYRIPFIAYWPGKIQPFGVSTAFVSHMDIYPSIVKLAGGYMPSNKIFDGIEMVSVFLGKTNISPRTSFMYYCGSHINAIRLQSYKIVFATQPFVNEIEQSCPFDFYIGGGACSCTSDTLIYHDPPLLFHVEYDPSERYILTQQNFPDYDVIIEAAVNEVERHIASVEIVEDQLSKQVEPRLQPCGNPPLCRVGSANNEPYGWRVIEKFAGLSTSSNEDNYLHHLLSFKELLDSRNVSMNFFTEKPSFRPFNKKTTY